ncbi:LysR family transcriptional regulator [[Clostridium] spiroforme]|nr:LysR family transcriptional regulator [Thomasclavelia spiroformis]MBM6879395.1 LysR family transcriptional regulator [Thomasclavelia spiroformis]
MNSQQLQCFIHVAERLNFSKAAESLYLSVPTVTHHIKSLEEEVKTQLFYRSSRVVKLTANGETFYHTAKDILYRMEGAKKLFYDQQPQKISLFRIGCMTAIELKILENVISKMKEQFPNIRPRIIIDDFFSLKNLYENGQLELVICTTGLAKKTEFKKIMTYQSYAVVPLSHPLAKQEYVTFEQLVEYTLITLPPRCIPFEKGNKLQEYLTLYKQDHDHIVSESEQEGLLLAKCGYGIALLPGFLIPDDDQVKKIPIAETENIDYGFFFNNSEKHIQFFIQNYLQCYQN